MNFIKFFYLISLFAIISAALAEDVIVETEFFKKYLDESVQETKRSVIHTSEIPSEVLQGFLQSPFKGLSIQKAYKVENYAVELPVWVKSLIHQEKESAKPFYVLALADNINQVTAVLSFTPQGKLLNAEKN